MEVKGYLEMLKAGENARRCVDGRPIEHRHVLRDENPSDVLYLRSTIRMLKARLRSKFDATYIVEQAIAACIIHPRLLGKSNESYLRRYALRTEYGSECAHTCTVVKLDPVTHLFQSDSL